MNNEITIEKREYEAKAGKAVAVGLNRMEQCDEIVKGERAGKVMANLAAVMFHLKETTRAMSAMGVELFRDNERVTLTVKEFDEAAKELLDREAKKKTAIQEDGQYMPLQLLVAGVMAWNLAFQELRHVLFDEERDEKKEFHQAMGRAGGGKGESCGGGPGGRRGKGRAVGRTGGHEGSVEHGGGSGVPQNGGDAF